jgi:hypothetical protein
VPKPREITPRTTRRGHRYRLAPDLAMERFGNKAVVLLAAKDTLITINRPAADLLELMAATFGETPFAARALAETITLHYRLTPKKAGPEARKLLDRWSGHGLLVPVKGTDRRS